MKLGIYGGTFNPIHNGHVAIAKSFLSALSLDKLIIIPTAKPPHKETPELIDGAFRLDMCTAAFAGLDSVTVSDIELRRGGRSFTIDTVEDMKRIYPDAEIFLLTGSDMFLTLDSWWRFDALNRLVTFCTTPRKEGEYPKLLEYADFLTKNHQTKCIVFNFPIIDVSSTAIREMLEKNASACAHLPACVVQYIKEKRLYMAETMEQYKMLLKERLTDKRYNHCLCVMDEAVKLAKRYDADEEKARIAGLLHDITKDTAKETQLQICEKYGIMLGSVELSSAKLWHAITGAAVLEFELKITDRDILNAVRYHTTARENMSLLEKIIYIADYISADRCYDGVDKLRETAYTDLNAVMKEALEFSIFEIVSKDAKLHLDTVMARNEYVRG